MWNKEWKAGIDYPKWGDTEVYKKTIGGGYLYNGENPKQAYERVCKTVAKQLGRPEMAETFFEYIWQGWLCLASPVLSNTGTDRGLPISCFGIDVADSIIDIGQKNLEMMLLAKHGGGVGIGINQIRPAGAEIKMNGTSDGVVPFCKIYDSTILATNQGAVRRGAASVNINIEHDDLTNGLKFENLKGMSTDNLSIYIKQLSLATSLCESLWVEMKVHGENGESYYKNVKRLESLISYLKETRIKVIHQLTRTIP